jgi:hypothetical protein
MGVSEEDSHRACAAHVIYLQWVASPILNHRWLTLAGLCIVMGIVAITAPFSTVSDIQIAFSLAAATNLVFTALTGKSIYAIAHIQCWKARPAGRILWIRHAASHVGLDRTLRSRYNTAIGIMYDFYIVVSTSDMITRLESGAIYCIGAIFMATVMLYDPEIFNIGLSIGKQLVVSPDSFRLI